MTLTKSMTAAALLGAITVSGTAYAQTAPTLVTAENPAAIVAVIQALGFQARLDKDSGGDPLIRSSSNGVDFGIYFYGCTKNKKCKSIQFSAGYDLDDGTTLDVIDDWNEMKRFASAYLDNENDPFLQMDVNMEGGITQENFEKNFDLWQTLKGQFEDHIHFNK